MKKIVFLSYDNKTFNVKSRMFVSKINGLESMHE
jgi:hypothetical protein